MWFFLHGLFNSFSYNSQIALEFLWVHSKSLFAQCLVCKSVNHIFSGWNFSLNVSWRISWWVSALNNEWKLSSLVVQWVSMLVMVFSTDFNVLAFAICSHYSSCGHKLLRIICLSNLAVIWPIVNLVLMLTFLFVLVTGIAT